MIHPKSLSALAIVGLLALGVSGFAYSDDDHDDHEGGEGMREIRAWTTSRTPRMRIDNATYQQECGACHMAYQPGLLPPRAWAEIMAPLALGDHFGDDASLAEAMRTEISQFLGSDSANLAGQAYPPDAMSSGQDLPRISATPGFQREHGEIPVRLVKDNPEVGSFSQCNACHRRAAEGDYSERWIDIPGVGGWKD